MPKPPDYRLQTVLEIRERKKEAAEQALGRALGDLKKEQDKQREMEEELERMIARREQKKREYAEKAMRGEMSAMEVVSANVFIERLKEQEDAQRNAIEGQKTIVAQRQEVVDNARQDLVKANQDQKALEKHKEKFIDEWKKDMQNKDQETLDDLAQGMFIRRERS